jgi:hypothetical protein
VNGGVHAVELRRKALASDKRARDQALVWSDHVFLFSLLLALFIVTDPFDWGFEHPSYSKHVPLMFLLAAFLLAKVGQLLRCSRFPREASRRTIFGVTYPLAGLAMWVLYGGCYTRFVDGIQDSFLTTGLYMLAGLAVAQIVVVSDARERLVNFACWSIAITAAYMIIRMAVEHVWSGGIYHELEFLVVPVAVFFAMKPAGKGRWLATLFFLAGGVVFLKNTGFIVLAITLGYLWWADWRFKLRSPARLYRFITVLTIAVAALLAGAALFGNALSDISMPDGNPGYRIRTYERAITRFLDSPIWGTSFVAQTTAHFTAFEIDVADGQLPTHSDVLDLAANGGVIALALLAWGYVRIGRFARATALGGGQKTNTKAAAHMFACMCLSGIAVYAFNPIMLQPDRAMLLWNSMGMLLGICLCWRPSREQTTSRSR